MFLVNSLRIGGSERKTVRLANALAADGHRVALAYLAAPESLLPYVSPAVATVNLQRRGKFSLAALRRLSTIVKERDVDTLVAVNLYSSLYAVLMRLRRSHRSLRVAVSVNTTEFASKKQELQMQIYRHILPRADVVVFGAECQRELWCSRYGLSSSRNRQVVLYNGVDTLEFSRTSPEPATGAVRKGSVTLGAVGSLLVEKAHIDLVRAVSELRMRGADVEGLIVGDGPERANIECEIRRLGVDGKVRIVGQVHDVRPYLASMDVFVLPSFAVETFSNAALEAMAMSCPVVAARVGGMEEMLRFGGGVTFPPRDLKSLCDCLMPLITDAHARRALGRQARQAAETHFSFGRMLGDFEARVLEAG